jgi:hypothetical protein
MTIYLIRFAAGRSTALVVDAGAGTTRVVPVYDGYVMHKSKLLVLVLLSCINNDYYQYVRYSKTITWCTYAI